MFRVHINSKISLKTSEPVCFVARISSKTRNNLAPHTLVRQDNTSTDLRTEATLKPGNTVEKSVRCMVLTSDHGGSIPIDLSKLVFMENSLVR